MRNTVTNGRAMHTDALLEVRGLKMHFAVQTGLLRRTTGHVRAVDGVTFSVARGKTLGLVGESGCGKTTAVRAIVRLYQPTGGEVLFRSSVLSGSGNGSEVLVDLAKLSAHDMNRVREEISMVFQDPIASLNPRMSVYEIVSEPLKIRGRIDGSTRDTIAELVERVGLRPEHMRRYPHEFSGGQRQRIGIARALALNPRLVVCDEPVSALDVSIQAQTLNLLQDLQDEHGFSYIFVAHDLSVVEHISDHVAVMYLGRIVEMGEVEALFARPFHPYTEALMSAVPRVGGAGKGTGRIAGGDVPDPSNPPSGCHFHPRCRYAKDICKTEIPALKDSGNGRSAACHFAQELSLAGV